MPHEEVREKSRKTKVEKRVDPAMMKLPFVKSADRKLSLQTVSLVDIRKVLMTHYLLFALCTKARFTCETLRGRVLTAFVISHYAHSR